MTLIRLRPNAIHYNAALKVAVRGVELSAEAFNGTSWEGGVKLLGRMQRAGTLPDVFSCSSVSCPWMWALLLLRAPGTGHLVRCLGVDRLAAERGV